MKNSEWFWLSVSISLMVTGVCLMVFCSVPAKVFGFAILLITPTIMYENGLIEKFNNWLDSL